MGHVRASGTTHFQCYRNREHKTSPGQIIYGNSIQLDRQLFDVTKAIASDGPLKLSKYLDTLLQQQMHVIQLAQKHQIGKDTTHIFKKEMAAASPTEYQLGSYVLLEYPGEGLRRGPPSKLMPFLEGPLKVVNVYGTRYTLQNLINGETRDVHVSRIRPFRHDSNVTLEQMRNIAIRDHHEYVVDSILEHTGTPKKRSEMFFKVRWAGYSQEHDSWEPWKNLRLVDKLHEYLRDNGMAKLIPADISAPADTETPDPTPPVPTRGATMSPEPTREDIQPSAKRQRRKRAKPANSK